MVVGVGGRIVVSAYVVCACRRVGIGRPWSVCAPRARHRPSSSLPCCPPGPRTWLQTFLRVSRAAAQVLPAAAWAGDAGNPTLFRLLGSLEPRGDGIGLAGLEGGDRQCLGNGLTQGGRNVPATPAELARGREGNDWSWAPARSWRRGAGNRCCPPGASRSVCDRERRVRWAERPVPQPPLRFEIRSRFSCRPWGRGTSPPIP